MVWIPLGIAAAFYAACAVAYLPAVLRVVYGVSDVAYLPVVAELSKRYGVHLGGQMEIQSSFTTLLFDLALRDASARYALWQSAPLLLMLSAVALTAYTVSRFADGWTTAATALLGACVSAPVVLTYAGQATHGPALASTQALACLLVYFHLRRPAGWRRLAIIGLAAVVIGPNLGSDPIVLSWALVPMVVIAWMTARHTRDAVVTAIAVGVVGVVTLIAVRRAGIDFYSTAVGVDWHHPRTALLRVLKTIPLGAPVFVVPALLTWRWRRVRQDWVDERLRGAADLFVGFWLVMLWMVPLSFIVTAANHDSYARYVLWPTLSAAVLLVPLTTRITLRQRVLTAWAIGAYVVFAGVSVIGLATLDQFQTNVEKHRPAIEAALATRHISVGYSAYWNSSAFTFATRGRVQTFAIKRCVAGMCQFPVNALDAWFVPRSDTRTFLLVDPDAPDALALAPPPEFGAPAEALRFGTIRVYVYDYDLASRIVGRHDPRWSPSETR